MVRFIVFVAVVALLLLIWGAYHAFIKRDFQTIKSDFTLGMVYLLFSGVVFYLLSLV